MVDWTRNLQITVNKSRKYSTLYRSGKTTRWIGILVGYILSRKWFVIWLLEGKYDHVGTVMPYQLYYDEVIYIFFCYCVISVYNVYSGKHCSICEKKSTNWTINTYTIWIFQHLLKTLKYGSSARYFIFGILDIEQMITIYFDYCFYSF